MYEAQSGEQVTVTPVTENKKPRKYFSSRAIKSSSVHPPIEEGKIEKSDNANFTQMDLTLYVMADNFDSVQNIFR